MNVPVPEISRASHLKWLLDKEVGSSYMAMSDEEFDKHCKKLSRKEVIEVVSSRKRKAKVLEDE